MQETYARWMVRATRSYAPVFEDSQVEAEATRRDMMDTLCHFVGLEVRIDRIERAPADAEKDRLAIADRLPPAN
jgi:hypothetical protein